MSKLLMDYQRLCKERRAATTPAYLALIDARLATLRKAIATQPQPIKARTTHG